MTPSRTGARPRSGTRSNRWRSCPHYHRAGTPDPARQRRREHRPATKHCGHRRTWVLRSGDDGATTNAEAAQRRKCDLCQTPGPTPLGARIRPSGCRVPDPDRRAQRLHRARHTRHRGRGMSLSREKGSPAINLFVQQSPFAMSCARDICRKRWAISVASAAGWWVMEDSNLRLLRCERSALPLS